METSSNTKPQEPLRAAEWQFPLGSCTARLSIVANGEGQIVPEDMDALRELADLIKRQLIRRHAPTVATKEN